MQAAPKCFLFPRHYPPSADTLLVKLLLSTQSEEGGLFQKIPSSAFTDLVEWVDSPAAAEYLVLSIDYSRALKISRYLDSFFRFACQYNLKTLIINHGDYSKPIAIDNGFVLRTSAYRSQLLPHEHIIPAFVEDIGQREGFVPREKHSLAPIIGFSGMVRLESTSKEIKYQLRLIKQWLSILFRGHSPASYQGLYYRRAAISLLRKSQLCETNFYIRDSFSRSLKTINGDPEQFRKEFIASITESDLALVVRGDGNFSLRFFEVLSLGRIPLYIDTDSPLPLENEIDYDAFLIRVPHTEVDKLPQLVRQFWDQVSPTEFITMQRKARATFEQLLRTDAFYTKFFQNL